jgi:hypothetical protein
MSTRGPVARALIGFGLLCGAFLALAGGIVLHGSSLWLVGVAAAIVACVAFGARDGGRGGGRAAAAWTAAASTVGVIMLVAGVVVLAGGALAAWVSGLAVVAGAGWLLRARWARHAGAKALGPAPGRGDGGPARLPALQRGRSEFPVSLLPTSVLGSEWLRTTATLACRLEHAARQAIIGRRQEILDELEARDPAGFARWLAAGAASDPATFVRFNRTMGTDAA